MKDILFHKQVEFLTNFYFFWILRVKINKYCKMLKIN